MSVEDLVPNPDGCTKFEANPFKKEVCKNCRRKWHEHKGVIAPAILEAFLAQAREAAAEREKARAAQLEKERAKEAAKKKASQAVEDEWFFEGKADGPDSDDEVGFRMLKAEDLSPQVPNGAKPKAKLVVKNLIDFGECDAADSEPLAQANGKAIAPAARAPSVPAPPTELQQPGPKPAPVLPQDAPGRPQRAYSEDMRSEIEHLQMCLAQANEAKQIELDIVKDELDEKERTIKTLVEERDMATEKLRAFEGHLASGTEVSDAAAELVSDLRALCAQTSGAAEADVPTGCRVRSMAGLESELRNLHRCITAAMDAARDMRAAPPRPPPPPAHAPELTGAAAPAAEVNGSAAGRPVPACDPSTEAQKAVHAIGVISAKAFKDIRISYDTQLVWIKERLSQVHNGADRL